MTADTDPQLNDMDLELLSAFIDRRLPAADQVAVERRLEHDPALQAALEELRATIGLLHDLPPARPPRSFALDPQAVAPKPAWSFPWMQLGSALVAMTLLVVFGFVLARSSGGGSTASAPIAASAPTSAPAAAAPMSAARATSAPAAAAPAAPMIAAEPAATPAATGGGSAETALQTPAEAADSANSAGAANPNSALKAATSAPAAEPAQSSATDRQASAGAVGAPAQPFNAQIATSGSSSPDTLELAPSPTPLAGAAEARPRTAGVFGIVLLIAIAGALVLLFLRRRR